MALLACFCGVKLKRNIFLGMTLLTAALWLTARVANAQSPGTESPAFPVATGLDATAAANVAPRRTVTYSDAVVLGLVEGITEFLPVSSIGHTILVTHALGLDLDQPLLDRNGLPILTHHHGVTAPLTLKDAVDTYNVMVQAGPIAAILLLYWARVASLWRGLRGRDPVGLRLLRNLLVAFIPAGVLGLLFGHWIHENLFVAKSVAGALIAGALVILAIERWRKHRHSLDATADTSEQDMLVMTWRHALLIGVCQCFSLWPGTSRSMTTIVGGYLAGLRPALAAEFSFLLGLITLTAAAGYDAVSHFTELREGLSVGPLLVGVVVATVAAALSVKWFIGWIARHGIGFFAWYRLALAAVVLGFLWR
jgi:undecaprenyl-diphosphatase